MEACCADGYDFGVRCRVVGAGNLIATFADDFVLVHHDRTEWTAYVGGDPLLCELDGPSHELLVKFRHAHRFTF